jgi:hypothetical protein
MRAFDYLLEQPILFNLSQLLFTRQKILAYSQADVTQYEVTASDAFDFVLKLSQVFSATCTLFAQNRGVVAGPL